MTTNRVSGIHHITATANDPQRTLDFYTQVIGLRLVKLTVNCDNPGTYHFYFGDEVGSPGTILTFFPWPHVPQGEIGTGQVRGNAHEVPSRRSPRSARARTENFHETKIVPIPVIDERESAGRHRVPGIRRNCVESGSQLCR